MTQNFQSKHVNIIIIIQDKPYKICVLSFVSVCVYIYIYIYMENVSSSSNFMY